MVKSRITKNKKNNWPDVSVEMSKEAIAKSFHYNRHYLIAKDQYTATSYDNYMALAYAIRDRLMERWITTQQRYHRQNLRRVYYLSMEFLIGRLLGNNILNLGLWEEAKAAMSGLGFDLDKIREQEQDAGLGNGGLGRLAACFLDSMATLGIPAHGYGIRYDYGVFNQKIVKGEQVEQPDEWLKLGNPWEIPRPEYAVTVKFYGKTSQRSDKKRKLIVDWVDADEILAMPYDIPVPGYNNDVVNNLRLWSARSTEEFQFEYFNHGDYEKAVQDRMISENISRVLYPNDKVYRGKVLRLKQEYFFTAASIADIIRRFKVGNSDIRKLPERIAIQLNDTHPALAVVELLRVLIDKEGLDWEAAFNIVVRTFAYTNHTVMPEALESWAIPLFEKVLPRHMELIYEINFRFLREVVAAYPKDEQKLQIMSIIEEGSPKEVRMANLSIVCSHSVNGVSELHTKLLKEEIFKDFYQLWPERFSNKTNGISQRRWLRKANPDLSKLISNAIGNNWITDLSQLQKLLKFIDDAGFCQKWQEVKRSNKESLRDYIYKTMGIEINVQAIFDVQVKRIHEYKRQMLFAFYIISQYLKIKRGQTQNIAPRVYIFSGKAAPGYHMAKLIIKFINSVAQVVNGDRNVHELIKVIFLENYRVSLAEKIFPASDLSEQISTAGTEASGTGCMKFMVNGALTMGTLDGANIEIAQAVGKENMFIFGLDTGQVRQLQSRGYRPQDYINNSPMLNEIFSLCRGNFLGMKKGVFDLLLNNLYYNDPYLICADFEAYCQAQEKVPKLYTAKNKWVKRSITNTAKSGRFSSDRTIRDYAKDIWNIPIE